MNTRMWLHPATQANVATLRARGVELVGPAEGELAEGEEGVGRMAEPEEIFARIEALLAPADGSLRGKRVLVSAGGTREPLDTVRYRREPLVRPHGRRARRGGARAGRRGDAARREPRRAVPAGVAVVETPTAADLEREALGRADADVIVMAAAVADYRAPAPLSTKRSKDGTAWIVELEPTTDVLAASARRAAPGRCSSASPPTRPRPASSARARSDERRTPTSFVFNDVSRPDIGFDAPENEVVVVSANGDRARREGAEAASSPRLFSTKWSGYSRRHDRRRARG